MEREIIQPIIESTEKGQLSGRAHESLRLLITVSKENILGSVPNSLQCLTQIRYHINPAVFKSTKLKGVT